MKVFNCYREVSFLNLNWNAFAVVGVVVDEDLLSKFDGDGNRVYSLLEKPMPIIEIVFWFSNYLD